MEKYAPAAEKGVPVFYDTTLVKARPGISMAGYPFTQIASELGNVSAVNILALGAMIARIPMVRMESLADVIRKRFAGKALEVNLAMLEKGAELVRQ